MTGKTFMENLCQIQPQINFYRLMRRNKRGVGSVTCSLSANGKEIVAQYYEDLQTELKVTECTLDMHIACMPFVKDG